MQAEWDSDTQAPLFILRHMLAQTVINTRLLTCSALFERFDYIRIEPQFNFFLNQRLRGSGHAYAV